MGNLIFEKKIDYWGFRVIEIMEDSPANKAGLIPFLDFIIGTENQEYDKKFFYHEFFNLIMKNENVPTKLKIFNIIERKIRIIEIIPNSKWKNADGILGVKLRYESINQCSKNIFRILEVLPDSIANNTDIKEEEDYILGSPRFYYKDIDEFFENAKKLHKSCIESEKLFKLPLIVFNVKQLLVRKIELILDKKVFFLGIKIGVGVLDNICLILNQ